QDSVSVRVAQCGREVGLAGEGGAPFREADLRSRIDHVGDRPDAGNSEWNGFVGLDICCVRLVDRAGFADVAGVPVIAVDARGERLELRLRPTGGVGAVGVSMN